MHLISNKHPCITFLHSSCLSAFCLTNLRLSYHSDILSPRLFPFLSEHGYVALVVMFLREITASRFQNTIRYFLLTAVVSTAPIPFGLIKENPPQAVSGSGLLK